MQNKPNRKPTRKLIALKSCLAIILIITIITTLTIYLAPQIILQSYQNKYSHFFTADHQISLTDDIINATIAADDPDFLTRKPETLYQCLLSPIPVIINSNTPQVYFNKSIYATLARHYANQLQYNQKRSNRLKQYTDTCIFITILMNNYSQEEILKLYTTSAYYVSERSGFRAASYKLFNKNPNELSLAQVAVIAGMPLSPVQYDPTMNPSAPKILDPSSQKPLWQIRNEYVLGKMLELELITKTQYEEAMNELGEMEF